MTNIVTTLDSNGRIIFVDGGIDEHGNPVKRTKKDHPWAYDGFVVYRALPNSETNATLYSDRIKGHYQDRWKNLCQKHFGTTHSDFDDRSPSSIESFLAELLNKPNLKIVFIMEYCNHANGFPVWRFDVKY